ISFRHPSGVGDKWERVPRVSAFGLNPGLLSGTPSACEDAIPEIMPTPWACEERRPELMRKSLRGNPSAEARGEAVVLFGNAYQCMMRSMDGAISWTVQGCLEPRFMAPWLVIILYW